MNSSTRSFIEDQSHNSISGVEYERIPLRNDQEFDVAVKFDENIYEVRQHERFRSTNDNEPYRF
jgi:hypothetical protein